MVKLFALRSAPVGYAAEYFTRMLFDDLVIIFLPNIIPFTMGEEVGV